MRRTPHAWRAWTRPWPLVNLSCAGSPQPTRRSHKRKTPQICTDSTDERTESVESVQICGAIVLLLFLQIRSHSRLLPIELQGARVPTFARKRDGELLDGRIKRGGRVHINSRQLSCIVGVAFFFVHAPLAGSLVHDELPFSGSFRWHGEDGVAALRYRCAVDRHVCIGNEGGRFIRAGAPNFSVRNQAAVDLASFCRGTAVINVDGFAVAVFAVGCSRRARTFRFIRRGLLCGHAQAEREHDPDHCKRLVTHESSWVELRM